MLVLAAFSVRTFAQVQYVDPTIGNVGILLEPTRPAVYLPNSIVRVYPIRADAMDDRIESFPFTINSHRMQPLFSIMPGEQGRRSVAYDLEKTTLYYYSARFDDSLIQTEFSPTERCGYFRFTFPSGNASVVLSNRQAGILRAQESTVAAGEERFSGVQAYVYGEFSEPVTFNVESADGKTSVTASRQHTSQLEFGYGISFMSVGQAKRNLRREIPEWGFDHVKESAKALWNQVLGLREDN